MAKNDILLLDQVVSEAAKSENMPNDGEFFQHFALDQVLQDRDLSAEEIDVGIVDGRDDGGIDAWYTFLDGEILTEPTDIPARRTASTLEILIFTCKRHDTFRLEPVLSLFTSVNELFDLGRDELSLTTSYNEDILTCRAIFREALIKTARANPSVSISFFYLSRGDSTQVGDAIRARSSALLASVPELVSNCKCTFLYFGGKELLLAYRKLKDFSARIKFEEGPLSRGPSNYTGLATLSEYFRFVTDAQGQLKRYLFEANVRDYMGRNYVNDSIAESLRAHKTPTEEDFWWLNNGATIIATRATVIGKELHLDNVQLVNGLQTTESIYKYLAQNRTLNDQRCILVKVLVTDSKPLADRIILATNNQTKVDSASLRATDKIQRDIEDLLAIRGWFYDRRKNYYRNHGKPEHRIVSMPFMFSSVMAIRLRQPHNAGRTRPKHMQSEAIYRRVFDERADLNVFLASLEICKDVETAILNLDLTIPLYGCRTYATLFRFLYATLYVVALSRKAHSTDSDILAIWSSPVDGGIVSKVHSLVSAVRDQDFRSVKRLHRNEEFHKALMNRLS